MKLEGTMLVVKDIDASRRFYTDVLLGKIIMDLDVYVVFDGGIALLAEKQWSEFVENPAAKFSYGNNVSQLAFEDDDIALFAERLKLFPDVEILTPLKEYPWGQRSIRFYDPDRHVVEVGESMNVVIKRFLQSGLSVEETMQKTMYPREFVEMCKAELAKG